MYPAQTCPCTFKTLLPVLLSALILLLAAPCHGKDPEAQFREGTTLLVQGDFEQKNTGIQKIAASGDQRAETLLLALLDGKLFHLKKDKTLVYATLDNSQAEITSVLSGEALGTVGQRKIKKITINNTRAASSKISWPKSI